MLPLNTDFEYGVTVHTTKWRGGPALSARIKSERTTLASLILIAVFYIKEPRDDVVDGNLSNEISHMNNLRYVIIEHNYCTNPSVH